MHHIWPFLVLIFILVAVHEGGHFLMARALGILVTDFAIGMGPRLCGFRAGGVEYSIRLFPVGGYVKFLGGEDPRFLRSCTIGLADIHRMFLLAPAWKRFLIVAAGPAANMVFAIAVIAGLYCSVGRPQSTNLVTGVTVDGPAYSAGLRAGDRIESIDGIPTPRFEDAQDAIIGAPGRSLSVVYERAGELHTVAVVPDLSSAEVFGRTSSVGRIGVTGSERVIERLRVRESVRKATLDAYGIFRSSLAAMGRIVGGQDSIRNLGGPVRIAEVTSNVAQSGIVQSVYLLALVSISLAVFNLLPIPLLDGGFLLLYAVEAITRRRVPVGAITVCANLGLVFMIGLLAVITWNDISSLMGM